MKQRKWKWTVLASGENMQGSASRWIRTSRNIIAFKWRVELEKKRHGFYHQLESVVTFWKKISCFQKISLLV